MYSCCSSVFVVGFCFCAAYTVLALLGYANFWASMIFWFLLYLGYRLFIDLYASVVSVGGELEGGEEKHLVE